MQLWKLPISFFCASPSFPSTLILKAVFVIILNFPFKFIHSFICASCCRYCVTNYLMPNSTPNIWISFLKRGFIHRMFSFSQIIAKNKLVEKKKYVDIKRAMLALTINLLSKMYTMNIGLEFINTKFNWCD